MKRRRYTVKEAQKIIRSLGLSFSRTPCGELRVNFRRGEEATAYYADDAEDAVNTARDMRNRAESLKAA